MTKSFLFVALVLGLVLDSDGNTDLETDDETEFDKDPALICLLFDHTACQLQCTLIYQAYDLKASGTCDENQTCQCDANITEDSLYDLLETKFHGHYVSRQLDDNHKLLQHVFEVFESAPLRTADQFKQLIKPYLTPYQFSTLEPNDKTLAAKFIEKDYGIRINPEAVQKYVTGHVARLVKSPNTISLLTVPYKDNFYNALKQTHGERGTLYNLTYRVSQLRNKSIKEVLKDYLKHIGEQEPEVDVNDDQDLNAVLAKAITNEIIALNDKKAKVQGPKTKKFAAKATPKPQRSF